MTRDPRLDPQPGDEVFAPAMGASRTVTERQGGDVRYIKEQHGKRSRHLCWITTWQDWCTKYGVEIVDPAP